MPAAPKKSASTAPKRTSTPKAAQPDAASDAADGEEAGPATPGTLRLKELVDRVVASTGGKKKGTKEIVEATLTQLGLALSNGEMLNLPEFGKLRVARPQGATPGSAMTLKLRPAGKTAKKNSPDGALAEPADQS